MTCQTHEPPLHTGTWIPGIPEIIMHPHFGLSTNPSVMSLILIPHPFNQVFHRVPFKFLKYNFYVMARTKRKKKEAMAERRSKEEWVYCLISFFKA